MKKLRALWEQIDNWWYWNTSRDHNVCETNLVLPGGPGQHHGTGWRCGREYLVTDFIGLQGIFHCLHLMILHNIRRKRRAKIKAFFMRLRFSF